MAKQETFFKYRKARKKTTLTYLGVLGVILLVTVFQDYLHSRHNSYSFYLSESLLFNLFWVLVIPIGLGLRYVFRTRSIFRTITSRFLKIILFVFAGSILHILFYSTLLYSISAIFYSHTYGFAENLRYTISQDLYKYLLIYAAISMVVFRKKADLKTVDNKSKTRDQLVINSGRSNLIVPVDQILFIRSSSPYIEIHTDDKKFLQSETLKSMVEKLDPSQFLQIHKSTIINLQQVVSYKSRMNGDYDVVLRNGQELRLSRNFVNQFKAQFKGPSS